MSSARKKRKNIQFKKALQNGTARNQQNRKFLPVARIVPAFGEFLTEGLSILAKLFQKQS